MPTGANSTPSLPPPTVTSCIAEEHGSIMAANALNSTLALFSEIVAGLELPTQPAMAGLLLARATLFALHWSFAALPLQVCVCEGVVNKLISRASSYEEGHEEANAVYKVLRKKAFSVNCEEMPSILHVLHYFCPEGSRACGCVRSPT